MKFALDLPTVSQYRTKWFPSAYEIDVKNDEGRRSSCWNMLGNLSTIMQGFCSAPWTSWRGTPGQSFMYTEAQLAVGLNKGYAYLLTHYAAQHVNLLQGINETETNTHSSCCIMHATSAGHKSICAFQGRSERILVCRFYFGGGGRLLNLVYFSPCWGFHNGNTFLLGCLYHSKWVAYDKLALQRESDAKTVDAPLTCILQTLRNDQFFVQDTI